MYVIDVLTEAQIQFLTDKGVQVKTFEFNDPALEALIGKTAPWVLELHQERPRKAVVVRFEFENVMFLALNRLRSYEED